MAETYIPWLINSNNAKRVVLYKTIFYGVRVIVSEHGHHGGRDRRDAVDRFDWYVFVLFREKFENLVDEIWKLLTLFYL